MKKGMLALATAALLPFSAAQAEDCWEEMQKVEQEVQKTPNASYLWRDVRSLRDSAQVFMRNQQEDACLELVDGMRNMLAMHKERVETEEERARRLAKLADAQPLNNGGLVRADQIIGTSVRSDQDEELGTIDNIAIDSQSGKINYLVMAYGGFIGLGEKHIAIPLQAIKRTRDGEVFVLELSQEELEKLDGFDEDAWPTAPNAFIEVK